MEPSLQEDGIRSRDADNIYIGLVSLSPTTDPDGGDGDNGVVGSDSHRAGIDPPTAGPTTTTATTTTTTTTSRRDDPPLLVPESYLESPTNDLENRPPPVPVISASSSLVGHNNNATTIDHAVAGTCSSSVQSHLEEDQDPLASSIIAVEGDGMDITNLESANDIISSPLMMMAAPSRFVPGPLREEPTLKEKLVDRERQRRKEAERARLKRQFALMSNGGGLSYDNNAGGGGGGPASTTGAVRENGSITGTVGEESTHADLEDSLSLMISPSHTHGHHHHQGDQSPQLGYTMERFLQERDATATRITTNIEEVATVAALATVSSSNNLIREEDIEGGPNTAGAPDKGVVMERFLNDPVVVDAAPSAPATLQEDDDDRQISGRPEDVHRSVSFDMELRTAQYSDNIDNDDRPTDNIPSRNTMDDRMHLSIDDSSVRVQVASEDDLLVAPGSPGRGRSVPSQVAPASPSTDDRRHHHHHHPGMGTSLGRVGPSMDQRSNSSNGNNANDDDDTDDEPRVLRLTEAEIQEMAAIEEASIGNAPPSDRDAESLVGDLVGEFRRDLVDVDAGGITFSQGTPTTAMESGSILSGNQIGAQRSSALPHRRNHDEEQPHGGVNIDDIDQNSIDDMAMSASVSSHLVVSPGASVSGSAVSVTANPPSEIIGPGEPTQTLMMDDVEVGDEDERATSPLPPPPDVVGSNSGPWELSSSPVLVVAENDNGDGDTPEVTSIIEIEASPGHPVSTLLPRPTAVNPDEGGNPASILEELRATCGPPTEEIVNRRMRPGMMNAEQQTLSPLRRIASLPDKINSGSIGDTPKYNRTVDEFDFDKNDLPMTPRSLLSDSMRELPNDYFWTSPGAKTSVSPIHQKRNRHVHRNQKVDPLLVVPTMARTEAEAASMQAKATANDQDSVLPTFLLTALCRAINDVRTNSNSTVEAKESELYDRSAVVSKALETRLLPLILTCIIEIPVLGMISGGSDRLCVLLGRHHQKLLIGVLPVIAAISGTSSAQASSLTTRAICHGHINAASFVKWALAECQVAAIVGSVMGAIIGVLSLLFTGGGTGKNVSFAVTVGIVQFISATCAGCMGTIAPLLSCFLFRQNARHLGGFLERTFPDVIATFLTTITAYLLLVLLVSPVNNGGECTL